MQSGHYDMGRFLVTQLKDDLSQIRFKDIDASSLQEGIQLNLRRSHGLDLDDLGRVLVAQQIEDDLSRLRCIGGPMNDASRSGAAGLELFEIDSQVFERVIADSRCRVAQLQPILFLRYPLGAIGLDDIRSVGDIPAQLGVV